MKLKQDNKPSKLLTEMETNLYEKCGYPGMLFEFDSFNTLPLDSPNLLNYPSKPLQNFFLPSLPYTSNLPMHSTIYPYP